MFYTITINHILLLTTFRDLKLVSQLIFILLNLFGNNLLLTFGNVVLHRLTETEIFCKQHRCENKNLNLGVENGGSIQILRKLVKENPN